MNYTHVFTPNTLNEAIFAQNRIEGFIGETGDFTIPNINVTGQSVGYGVGFAQGNFIQHNYQWRDVLTHVRGAHVLKFGYEGWFGDDVEPFQGPWSHPEVRVRQSPETRTGRPAHAGQRHVRPDDRPAEALGVERGFENLGRVRPGYLEGPPQSDRDARLPLRRSGEPVVAEPTRRYSATSIWARAAPSRSGWRTGGTEPTDKALKSIAQGVQPASRLCLGRHRRGRWVVRGGAGMYANWLTPANVQEEFRGNPPGLITADFLRRNLDAAGLRAGNERHAAFRIPVPAAGRIAPLSDGAVSR